MVGVERVVAAIEEVTAAAARVEDPHAVRRHLHREALQLDHPRAPSLLADYLERCCDLNQLQPADEWHATARSLRDPNASKPSA